MSVSLTDVYERLLAHFGPQHWWPADSPLEGMIGAMLTQNTSWKNVERAIDNLREAGLLEADALYALELEELAEVIRPAGYYRLKAGRLHNLIQFLIERYEGSVETISTSDPDALREEFLSIKGIGPETADSILLYALDVPTFVVDTYTHRITARHGWIDFETNYHGLKEFFESNLPVDTEMFNEYHALLVRVGNQYCRRKPKCEQCPLYDLLPEGGPLEPV